MLWWYVPGAVRIEMLEHRLVQVRQLQEREGRRPAEGLLQERQQAGGNHGDDQAVGEPADDVRDERPRVALHQGEGDQGIGVGEADRSAGAEEGSAFVPVHQGEDPDQAADERQHEVLERRVQHQAGQDGEAQRSGERQTDVEQHGEQDAAQRHGEGGPQCREREVRERLVQGRGHDQAETDEDQDHQQDRAQEEQAARAGDLLGLQAAHIGVERRQEERHQQEHSRDRPDPQRQGKIGDQDLDGGQQEEYRGHRQEPALLFQAKDGSAQRRQESRTLGGGRRHAVGGLVAEGPVGKTNVHATTPQALRGAPGRPRTPGRCAAPARGGRRPPR